MSNVGRWEPWYSRITVAQPYGNTLTYPLAAEFLRGLAVEDWGCGFGWFRRLHDGPYWGVDGTAGFCDEVDDLTTRRSVTPGLLLRHVLEHNEAWPVILDNAVASAKQRLVIVTFIPSGSGERVGWTDDLGVPDLAIPHEAIDAALAGWVFSKDTLDTQTAFGTETIWRASWPGPVSAS